MPKKEQITHNPIQIVDAFSRCTRNGFVASNLDGEITYVSKTMEEITGWLESEIIGKPVAELYALPESFAESVDDDEAQSQPAMIYKRDGQKLTLPARQVTIRSKEDESKIDGHLVLFITNTSDVDRAQTEFVSTVSHELRTPITSIKGFAATLLQHRSKLPEDKRKRYVNVIKDQADRLSRLVEDLLAVSRLESRKLQLTIQPINMKSAVEKASTIVETGRGNSHAINIVAEDDLPTIWADADRLEQILTNLIDNAVKYSPEADKIDIKIYPSKWEKKDIVRVDVRDYGIGISEEDRAKIFDKFSRLDSPLTRTTEGTGLGLFITKSLAKMLGGDVLVDSSDGGTTFSLVLSTELPETSSKAN